MYWSDTKAHTVYALDFDPFDGSALAAACASRSFPLKQPGQDLSAPTAAGPDGAAVDGEGCLLDGDVRGTAAACGLSPAGEVLQRGAALPVRCATMPCFGGADLKTLYITTARENRPGRRVGRACLHRAGRVLHMRVEV